MPSRPNPLTPSPSNLSHTLTSTHTHHQHIPPYRHFPHCIQAGSGNPTAQKTYIKHFSYRKLQTCLSLLPFIAKTLERVVFNQVSLFLSQNNWMLNSQVSGVAIQLRLRYSVTEALRIAKADSKSSGLILLDLSAAFDTVNHQILLSGMDESMDERTSPTAQPGKDWASRLPCYSNSTAWLYDSVRFINNCPINFGQKSWCNLWWPADLQRAHCKDCSILQVCTTQHQKNQALSDRACCKTSCPGPCHF